MIGGFLHESTHAPIRGRGVTQSESGNNCEGKRTTRPLPLALLITAAPQSPEGLSGVTRANLLCRIRPQTDAREVPA